MKGRVCAGCGHPSTPKLGGVLAFLGAFWHRACFAKASPGDRAAAREAVEAERQQSKGS